MEFYKDENGKYSKLKQHNVDTGLGLERMTMLLEAKKLLLIQNYLFQQWKN